MKAAIFAFVGLVAIASAAESQTIRPLVSEHQREARGRFEVVNDSDRPLNVVIEPRGFTVDASGEMHDEPLPAHVRLRLSDTSFRLPPRQSRFVFYEASAGAGPAWFVLYANLTGFPARDFSGLNVQLELPHIVYLLPPEQWSAGDLRVAEVNLQPAEGKLTVTVENSGALFGRIGGLEIRAAGRRVEIPGFALFPGGRRRIEVPWVDLREPEVVTVNARNFSFEYRPVPVTDR